MDPGSDFESLVIELEAELDRLGSVFVGASPQKSAVEQTLIAAELDIDKEGIYYHE